MQQLPTVDWSYAARSGRAIVPPGPTLDPAEIADIVAELRAAAERSTWHVAEVTQMEHPAPADVLVVDRGSWIAAVCQSADALLTGSGAVQEATATGLATLSARALGLQAAPVFAAVATRVLGQFDPFVTPARLLLVAPNIVSVERELNVRPADFRLWVCLHEETHRFQFGQAPWLTEHVLALLGEVLDGDELSFGWPEGRGGARGLIGSPAQREAFDHVSAVMSLMEGHADVMMDRVGVQVVPTYATIRRAFETRRDRQGWASWLWRLLGMDLKRAQYRDGAEFCRQVIAASDVGTLNRAFEAPGLLPTMAEIRDPQQWLHRI